MSNADEQLSKMREGRQKQEGWGDLTVNTSEEIVGMKACRVSWRDWVCEEVEMLLSPVVPLPRKQDRQVLGSDAEILAAPSPVAGIASAPRVTPSPLCVLKASQHLLHKCI